jgi:membrane-associated protease RseP (regulator of RpoE activity)
MVTVTGGWHVRYGFGVPKKTIRRMPMPYVIVLPEEVEIPEEKADQQMDVDLPEIPLLPGDFAWMVPYEDLEKDKVRMGVRIAAEEGKVTVEGVEDGSPAEKAGIQAGSVIVSFDGRPVADMTDVFYLVGAKRAGDRAVVVVRRDGVDRTHELTFFKMPKKKNH